MKKVIIFLLQTIFFFPFLNAQEEVMSDDSMAAAIQLMEASLDYKTDTTIELGEGNGILNIPTGFKFLDEKQAQYVLTELWGNPENTSILGLLVPKNTGVLDSNSWVFTISYEDMGYVEDDDAEDIKYDELLTDMKKEIQEANPERISQGYGALKLIGWASTPFYDKKNRVLHWAKELEFNEDPIHTLNYNLRVLGRKGVYVINAVANMDQLPLVKSNIDGIISSVQYKEGSKYLDFNPKVDKVAAWTIGGLVAGKVLAKAGFLAIILKFGKILLIPFLLLWGYIKRIFTGKSKEQKENTYTNSTIDSEPTNSIVDANDSQVEKDDNNDNSENRHDMLTDNSPTDKNSDY